MTLIVILGSRECGVTLRAGKMHDIGKLDAPAIYSRLWIPALGKMASDALPKPMSRGVIGLSFFGSR